MIKFDLETLASIFAKLQRHLQKTAASFYLGSDVKNTKIWRLINCADKQFCELQAGATID